MEVKLRRLLYLCLLFWSFPSSQAYVQTYCVTDNKTSSINDAELEAMCGNSTVSMREISNAQMKSSTNIIFFPGTFILDFYWEFYNVSFIQMKSVDEYSKVTIECIEEGATLFRNSSNVIIANLELLNCNFVQETILEEIYRINITIIPSLYILYGHNFTVTNITIVNATTGFCIVDVSGDVILNNVKVYGQFANQSGIFPGNLILYRRTMHKSHLSISEMNISDCGIMNIQVKKSPFFTPSGLVLLFNSTEVTATLQNSSFTGNKGQLGGNVQLIIYNITSTDDIAVVSFFNVIFEKGEAAYGGGLFVSFEQSFYPITNNQTHLNDSAFKLKNCRFERNYALEGGGGLYIQWVKSMIVYGTYYAHIVNSFFIGNFLNHGGAGVALQYKVYVNSPTDHQHKNPRFSVEIYVRNCDFKDHTKNGTHSQSGVIFANSAKVMLNSVTISDNGFSGILVIGSEITFSGSSIIANNSAISGGGIRLCSSSLIYFKNNSELHLSENKAKTVGGGIAVDNKCLVEMPMCFYQFMGNNSSILQIDVGSFNTSIILSNNKARIAGSNLYGGSIDFCFFYFTNNKNLSLMDRFLYVHPYNDISSPSSVSSNPQHVCIVEESNFTCLKEKHNVSIFPGQIAKLNVRIVGQCNGSVPGIVHIDYPKNTTLLSKDSKNVANLSGEYIDFQLASRISSPSYRDQYLSLHVGVGSSFVTVTEQSQFPPAKVHFHFIPCPVGFNLTQQNDYYVCDCTKLFHPKLVSKCKLDENYALIVKKSYAWIGVGELHGQQAFLSAKCPLDYCNRSHASVSLINSNERNKQCKYNRVGILCGSCPKGWSMMFGTFRCSQHCSNLSLLLIIPILLAGLLLFFLTSCLDLTVTCGAINGVIFYTNILQAYQVHLLVEHPIQYLSQILEIFLAWFNLDIGIPLCFFKGMNTFSKVLLEGAFPIYLWIIALAIIQLSNRNVRLTRLLGKNPVQVLATLILLSYSKMLRVTLVTLNFTELHFVFNNGTPQPQPELRWYLDSSKIYLTSSYHLILVIVALLFVTLTFPFTISLLCIRHIFSLSTFCRCFNFINKLKPFFDAFSGPFKDNARFWPGLLLLVRLFLLLVKAFPNVHAYYIITITVSLLSGLMVYLNGIYKKRILDIIEHSLLLNLAIIFATLTATTAEKDGCSSFCKLTTYGALLIAFVTFIGIVGYHLMLKLCSIKCSTSAFVQNVREFDVSAAVRGRFSSDKQTSSYEEDLHYDTERLVDVST